MVKEIPLQNGMVALVDDEDFERVSHYVWTVNNDGRGGGMKVRTTIQGKTKSLSKVILCIEERRIRVLHKNKNSLDYRKENLIVGDAKLNVLMKKGNENSSSKYKGVSWDKKLQKWTAQTRENGKKKHLGVFLDEDEAAKAYNEAVLKIFGENCYLNVIGENNNTETIQIEKVQQTRKKNKTGFKGVYFSGNLFQSSITTGKKSELYLGTFNTLEQAAKAYDQKAYELYGDKSILNFPELKSEYEQALADDSDVQWKQDHHT
ncbi:MULTISPECIES: AP2 domain-containing protein [Lysinibacillus]|uniref:AP2 domain-containing protein n=1 Tax=Lysinibacillus TaxID=400634 RepID=UPI0006944038|nr:MULTISPECIES: AP2 domain-containing protein [Lysinibacillus]